MCPKIRLMKCSFPEITRSSDCPPEIVPFREINPDHTCEICCQGQLNGMPNLFVLAKALNIYIGSKDSLDKAVEHELERRNLPIRDVDDNYPRPNIFNVWRLLH